MGDENTSPLSLAPFSGCGLVREGITKGVESNDRTIIR